jgi:hypothetical protein
VTKEKAMETRERLQLLVDNLADSDVQTAIRLLEALREKSDPVALALLAAPLDDERDEDDRDGGLTEGRAETSLSHDEVRSRFKR